MEKEKNENKERLKQLEYVNKEKKKKYEKEIKMNRRK